MTEVSAMDYRVTINKRTMAKIYMAKDRSGWIVQFSFDGGRTFPWSWAANKNRLELTEAVKREVERLYHDWRSDIAKDSARKRRRKQQQSMLY